MTQMGGGKEFSHSLGIHLKQALFYSLYGRVSEFNITVATTNDENIKQKLNSIEKIGKRLLKEYERIIEWMENEKENSSSSSLNECKCLFMDWNLLKRRFNYLKFKFYASFVERTRKLDSMMRWFAKFTRMIVFPIRMLRKLILSSMKIHISSELKSLIIVPREKLSWIVLFSDRVLARPHASVSLLLTCWKHVKAEIERVKKLRYGTIVERLQLYLVFRKLSLELEKYSHSSHARFLLDFSLDGLEKLNHDTNHLTRQPFSPAIDSFVHMAKVYNPIENEEYSNILTFEMLDNLLEHVGVKPSTNMEIEDITMIFLRILDSMEVISRKCIQNLLSKLKINGKIEKHPHISKSHLYKSFNVWKSMFSKVEKSKTYPFWEEIEEFMDTFIHLKGGTVILSFFMFLFNVKTLVEFITCKYRGTFVNVNINQSIENTLHQAHDMLMNLESGLNEEYSEFSYTFLRQNIGEICNFEELLVEIDSNRKKHSLQNFIIDLIIDRLFCAYFLKQTVSKLNVSNQTISLQNNWILENFPYKFMNDFVNLQSERGNHLSKKLDYFITCLKAESTITLQETSLLNYLLSIYSEIKSANENPLKKSFLGILSEILVEHNESSNSLVQIINRKLAGFNRKFVTRFSNRIIDNELEMLAIISNNESEIVSEWISSKRKELILKMLYSCYISQTVNYVILNKLLENRESIPRQKSSILLSVLIHSASIVTVGANLWMENQIRSILERKRVGFIEDDTILLIRSFKAFRIDNMEQTVGPLNYNSDSWLAQQLELNRDWNELMRKITNEKQLSTLAKTLYAANPKKKSMIKYGKRWYDDNLEQDKWKLNLDDNTWEYDKRARSQKGNRSNSEEINLTLNDTWHLTISTKTFLISDPSFQRMIVPKQENNSSLGSLSAWESLVLCKFTESIQN